MLYYVKSQEEGMRADKLVSDILEDIPRAFVSKNIDAFVLVDGKKVKQSYRLKEAQKITIDIEGLKKKYSEEIERLDLESNIIPQKSALNIVHESKDYIVLKKPSGLVVHPGISHERDTLANYVKSYLAEKKEYDLELKRAGIVHRLDMPVSGLIVFAKNRKFQKHLSKQFEDHEVLKIYHAEYEIYGGQKVFDGFKKKELVNKVIEEYEQGKDLNLSEWIEVSGSIRRDPSNRKRMLFERNVKNDSLRYAQSYLLPLSESKMCVLIKTGRMHQIRATLKNMGVVLKGDKLYGYKGEDKGVISLKSVVLGFVDMQNEKKVFNILNALNG